MNRRALIKALTLTPAVLSVPVVAPTAPKVTAEHWQQFMERLAREVQIDAIYRIDPLRRLADSINEKAPG